VKGTGESLPASLNIGSISNHFPFIEIIDVACRICCTEMGIKASPLNNLVTTKINLYVSSKKKYLFSFQKYMNLALKHK